VTPVLEPDPNLPWMAKSTDDVLIYDRAYLVPWVKTFDLARDETEELRQERHKALNLILTRACALADTPPKGFA
jgi:hypothetical protein